MYGSSGSPAEDKSSESKSLAALLESRIPGKFPHRRNRHFSDNPVLRAWDRLLFGQFPNALFETKLDSVALIIQDPIPEGLKEWPKGI
jgi:hypothetical protein